MYSDLPVQQAIISYVTSNFESEPVQMHVASAEGQGRYIILQLDDPEKSVLRLALNIANVMYYAETTAVFVDYQTSFSRDNFPQ